MMEAPSTASARKRSSDHRAEMVSGAPVEVATRVLGNFYALRGTGTKGGALYRKQSCEGEAVPDGDRMAVQQRAVSG